MSLACQEKCGIAGPHALIVHVNQEYDCIMIFGPISDLIVNRKECIKTCRLILVCMAELTRLILREDQLPPLKSACRIFASKHISEIQILLVGHIAEPSQIGIQTRAHPLSLWCGLQVISPPILISQHHP